MKDLTGRFAVVTGGASGIGKGIAEAFADEGMRLVLADVEDAALDQAVAEFEARGAKVIGVRCDVADPESVEALAQKTLETYGAVHVVCNNAGVSGSSGSQASWEAPLTDWEWGVGVNMWGVVYGHRSFIPKMIEGGDEGHIVNTASMAGLMSGAGIYGLTKHAVVAITESIFGEFQNPYSTEGFPGFTFPALALDLLNLWDPSYGMFFFGPLLILGLVPAVFYHREELILPRPERIFAAVLFAALLTFCAANQYSRIQFNSGFRYLVPLVPIMFLAASDHLSRMPRKWLWVLAIPVLLNSWVIAMVREPVPASWREVLSNGIQFPWLAVLRETLPQDHPVGGTLVPLVILVLVTATIVAIWKVKIPQAE